MMVRLAHVRSCDCFECTVFRRLSERELLILNLLTQGHNYQEIAPRIERKSKTGNGGDLHWRSIQRIATEICEKIGANTLRMAIARYVRFQVQTECEEQQPLTSIVEL